MQAWDKFLSFLETEYGEKTIETWLKPIKVISFDAGNLYLEAADSFQLGWFEEHARSKSEKYLVNNNGRPIKVHITLGNPSERPQAKPEQAQSEEKPLEFNSDKLDPYLTFEQFIPGSHNEVPFQVLCKLTGFNPETNSYSEPEFNASMYNPIFLYGPPGCGKSHLMMATAAALTVKGKKIFYVHAKTFTEHVVAAIRQGKMQPFRAAYRHVDVLIIEDVQDLGKKSATQEELFHTFNTLHTAGKQIILCANTAPRQLEAIEDRLISRFEWGITLPLVKIATTTDLHNLLQKRSHLFRFPMETDLMEFITQKFPTAKALSKAIDSLILHTHLEKIDHRNSLALYQVKDHLVNLHLQDGEEQLTPEKLVNLVSEIFGVKEGDILGKSQTRDCAFPRQVAMYLLRSELKLPYVKIGNVFSRDHSTVMSSIKSIKKGLENKDRELIFYLSDIQKLLAKSHSR